MYVYVLLQASLGAILPVSKRRLDERECAEDDMRAGEVRALALEMRRARVRARCRDAEYLMTLGLVDCY